MMNPYFQIYKTMFDNISNLLETQGLPPDFLFIAELTETTTGKKTMALMQRHPKTPDDCLPVALLFNSPKDVDTFMNVHTFDGHESKDNQYYDPYLEEQLSR